MKTRILSRSTIEKLVDAQEVLEAVEEAFRAYGQQQVQMPPKVYMFYPEYEGDLRTMPAYIASIKATGVKIVNVHVRNHDRNLPTVMATIVLNDPETGYPIAVMDGTLITALRTGAAGAIAVKHLARQDARRIALVGCGTQAETQLLMTRLVTNIEEVVAYDVDTKRWDSFCRKVKEEYGFRIIGNNNLDDVYTADIITTTTPVHQPIIKTAKVQPGTHINAIGADAPGKQELETELIFKAKVVVDNWEQASHSGEINIPVERHGYTNKQVYAELGAIVAGLVPGRTNPTEITVFDSTGLAIQDIATAVVIYRKSQRLGLGQDIDLVNY